MPNIKKVVYDQMKHTIEMLQLRLSYEKSLNDELLKCLRDEQNETEKWKRYYNAVRETFKVEEEVEIPGCFSPMDTVEYIVKKQEEINHKLDEYNAEIMKEAKRWT